jgi:hypothetical protein
MAYILKVLLLLLIGPLLNNFFRPLRPSQHIWLYLHASNLGQCDGAMVERFSKSTVRKFLYILHLWSHADCH